MTKYAGLMLITDPQGVQEKKAFLDNYAAWQARHPWLSIGSYLLPLGAGAVPFGLDAARSFSQGKYLSGLGNLAGAVASVAGGGWLAKMLGKGIGAMGRGATAASKAIPALSHVEPAIQRAAPVASQAANRIDQFGRAAAA